MWVGGKERGLAGAGGQGQRERGKRPEGGADWNSKGEDGAREGSKREGRQLARSQSLLALSCSGECGQRAMRVRDREPEVNQALPDSSDLALALPSVLSGPLLNIGRSGGTQSQPCLRF